MKPLIHYLFRHSIDMEQPGVTEDVGSIEREFVNEDPMLARKAALDYFDHYRNVLQQTHEFNTRMELEHYVKSLYGHPTPAVIASRAWREEDNDTEIGYVDTDHAVKLSPVLLMVIDESLAEGSGSTELLIRDDSDNLEADGTSGFKNTEQEQRLYEKAGYEFVVDVAGFNRNNF